MNYRHIAIGVLLGVGAYALYRYELQKNVAFPGGPYPLGVPLGSLINPIDPVLYVAAAAGGILGKVFG